MLGKRQRDAEPFIVASYWYHCPLIAKDDLRDPRRCNTDAELARVIALDNGDIGVAHAVLDLPAHAIKALAALADDCTDRDTRDGRLSWRPLS
jgi:hypothetical protein